MRYLEIDLVRGISTFLMVAYHFFFDVYFPNYSNIYFFAIPIASCFILISGICSYISYSRKKSFHNFLRRGIKLLFFSSIISLSTFILLESGLIIFGILHFFALTSFLVYPFLKYIRNKNVYFLLGIFSIIFGLFLLNIKIQSYYFIWLGITPSNFFSFDYFPLFPWFGLLLIGIFFGKIFYPEGERKFKLNLKNSRITKFFAFLGEHSLTIYFLHQPIIILILSLGNLAPLKIPFKFLWVDHQSLILKEIINSIHNFSLLIWKKMKH
jgi:uncharacterized membrane protein